MHYNNVIEIVQDQIDDFKIQRAYKKNPPNKNKTLDIEIDLLKILVRLLKNGGRDGLLEFYKLWAISCEDYLYKIRNI